MNNPWQHSMKKAHQDISEWLNGSQKVLADIELPQLTKEQSGDCFALLADLSELLEKANSSFWIGFGLLHEANRKLWDITEMRAGLKKKQNEVAQ